MTNQIILTVPIDEFTLLMADVVNECLHKSKQNQGSPPTEIIKRCELCRRLDITEPTAIRWEKKGKIPCFEIGSNVRYNWPNVVNALEGKLKAGAKCYSKPAAGYQLK